jgi:hypothetical protein
MTALLGFRRAFSRVRGILPRKRLLLTSMALAGVCVSAAASAGVWSNVVQIASIEVDDTGTGTSTYLAFTTTATGKPSCGTSGQVIVSGSVDNVKAITALATSAFLAGRSVKVYFDGTCSGVYAKFPLFSLQ